MATVLEDPELNALWNQASTDNSFFFAFFPPLGVVATVLEDPKLNALWNQELTEMSTRITDMRTALVAALQAIRCGVKKKHACVHASVFENELTEMSTRMLMHTKET